MSLPSARLGDPTAKGVIVTSSRDVFVNNIPSARHTDKVVGSQCGGPIGSGSRTVFVNNLQSARVTDPTPCGPIKSASRDVFVGG